jgi:hypothetical protein
MTCVDNQSPKDAIVIPDEQTKYLTVWQTEDKLVLRLEKIENGYPIFLDKKILPDLVDALIELQNR